MTSLSPALVEELRRRFGGPVIGPGDRDYDEARAVWNGSIDRRPAFVVRPRNEHDVAAALSFACARGLTVAVRGGGHNVAGFGTCDDGIVVDLSLLRAVGVDPGARRARVGGGALWRDVDAATQSHGLAVTGGLVSTTGVGGFTLGGGIGWLQRRHGLAADNLVGARLVTAAGDVVDVTEEDNPELLWGLRGGGGNFGVVTEFRFRLHQVGPEVAAGIVFFPGDELPQVVEGFERVAAGAPDELGAVLIARRAPAAPFLPEEVHGRQVVGVAACHGGDVDEGLAVLAEIAGLGSRLGDSIRRWRYVEWQQALDPAWSRGFGNYWKAEYVRELPQAGIEALGVALASITSPLSDFKLALMGGAVARVPEDATAYGHRGAPYVLNINARWDPGDAAAPHEAWTRALWDAIQPFSDGGSYVNFMGEEGAERVRAAYGAEKFARLVALKRRYDPDNVFRLNQNIPPGAA